MIIILVTYYNSSKYIGKTIESLKKQTVKDWKCYITNDLSTDEEFSFVKNLVKNEKQIELIKNKTKHYQTGNYWQILQKEEIYDEDICITLDGDDWFMDKYVLQRVLDYYKNKNIWMSFGQFVFWNGKEYKKGFTHKPKIFNNARLLGWTSSHLRTFKAHLFRRIHKKDLINPETNNFWQSAGDVVCFCPMLEMAGEDRILYVDDINYVYNTETELNDYKVNLFLQEGIHNIIKNKKPYRKI